MSVDSDEYGVKRKRIYHYSKDAIRCNVIPIINTENISSIQIDFIVNRLNNEYINTPSTDNMYMSSLIKKTILCPNKQFIILSPLLTHNQLHNIIISLNRARMCTGIPNTIKPKIKPVDRIITI